MIVNNWYRALPADLFDVCLTPLSASATFFAKHCKITSFSVWSVLRIFEVRSLTVPAIRAFRSSNILQSAASCKSTAELIGRERAGAGSNVESISFSWVSFIQEHQDHLSLSNTHHAIADFRLFRRNHLLNKVFLVLLESRIGWAYRRAERVVVALESTLCQLSAGHQMTALPRLRASILDNFIIINSLALSRIQAAIFIA
jgi:hypothetical protein